MLDAILTTFWSKDNITPNCFSRLLVILTVVFISTSTSLAETAPFKLEISSQEGICRAKTPLMLTLKFYNTSNKPQKLCTYRMNELLVKLNVKNAKGEILEMSPKTSQIGEISEKDWITINPNNFYKSYYSIARTYFALNKKPLPPGNYTVKATYEGCSKFDPSQSPTKIDSNALYLMVIE